jgi:hypothetical protein
MILYPRDFRVCPDVLAVACGHNGPRQSDGGV